jgi:LPXTG-motif cell wall-anchored protein
MFDSIMNFMTNTWFMVSMGVLLLALIGVFFYVRKQQSED